MNRNKQGRDPIYPESFKIAVAREYLTGNLGYSKLAVKHGLAGPAVVRHFIRWYRKRYPDHGAGQHIETGTLAESSKDRLLEKQLQEANLKIAGLEMLIEIAQKELGIDIVKKPGTKQSLK